MPAPVALIHGLFGWGFDSPLGNRVSSYWPDSAFSAWNGDVVAVDVGPISSLHDRACEAFYQLRGGTVDYGEVHSYESRMAFIFLFCSTFLIIFFFKLMQVTNALRHLSLVIRRFSSTGMKSTQFISSAIATVVLQVRICIQVASN